MEDKRFTKHGFPKGFRFVPTNLELITILSHTINGRWLHPKVAGIFHGVEILNYHPKDLHAWFERDKEDRYIYFFSSRRFPKTAGGGGPVHKKRQRGRAAGQDEDEDDNDPRPVRLARGGGWKASGGAQPVYWPKDKGGFVAGKMVTMVFYDHRDGGRKIEKSLWGMHEFTVPVDQPLLSKLTKTTHWHDLALYRLYRLGKGDGMESDDGAESDLQTLANDSAADGRRFSAPCPALAAAGASTSRMPPPPQLQHHIPSVGLGHPPHYYHRHQYAFGAPPARAAHQRVGTMTMPPAYGAGMPGRPLYLFARPPGRQSLQFGRPPAPSQMPVPPAADGQQASHSGATRSPLSAAPVSTPPPAADPMTATHGGAGQQASGNFGAARSSQGATATADVELAGCVNKPEDNEKEIADSNDGMAMPDYDLDLAGCESDERFLFTMDELFPTFELDEPQPTQQGDNN